MTLKFVLVLIGTWFLFMASAIINAGIRNGVFEPIASEQTAHQISTLVFMTIILFITYLVLRFSKIELSTKDAFLMGFVWLVLTICFEFIAGHYIFGNSWVHLIADYNILKGRIWSFVLVTIFFSPYLTSRFI